MVTRYLLSLLVFLLFSSNTKSPTKNVNNSEISVNWSGTSTINLDNLKSWKWILEPKYSYIDFFETRHGFLYLDNDAGEKGLVAYPNINKWIIEPQFKFVTDRGHVANYPWLEFKDNNDKYGFINLVSGKILPWRLDDYHDGIYSNYSIITKSNQQEVINLFTGERLFEKKFERIEGLNTVIDYGMAAAKQNGKWGVINNRGEWLIENKFDELNSIYHLANDGMAAVKQNGKWGTIDIGGNWIIPNQYDYLSIWELIRTEMTVAQQNGKWGIIDITGNWLVQNQFDRRYNIQDIVNHGIAKVHQNGKWGIIDKNGKWLIQNRFDDIDIYNIQDIINDGMAKAQQNGKWGIIDKNGKWLVSPNFDKLNSHIETFVKYGQVEVELNGKVGIIDKRGNWVIKPMLDKMRYFPILWDLTGHGKAIASQNEKWGIIDKNGTWLVNPTFNEIRGSLDNKNDVYLQVKQGNKWGIIDSNGQWFIHPKFDKITTQRDCYLVKIKEKWGVLDKNLNWLINPQFDEISFFLAKYELFGVVKNNKKGIVNKSGNYITKDNYTNFYIKQNDLIALYKESDLIDIYHLPSKKNLLENISMFNKLGAYYITGYNNNAIMLFDPISTLQKTIPYQNSSSDDIPHFKLKSKEKWGLGLFSFSKSENTKVHTLSRQLQKINLRISDIEGIMQLMINGESYDLAHGFYDEIEVFIENKPEKLTLTIKDYAGNTYNTIIE